MLEYRFTLENDTEGTQVLEFAPDGWMPDGVQITRNEKYLGLFRKLTVNELSFVRDGKTFVDAVYAAERTNGKIDITIEQYNTTTFTYETVFTGIIDLSTYKSSDINTDVAVIDTSFAERFKSREKLNVDLRSLYTVEDDSITPFTDETPELVLPDIITALTASWAVTAGTITTLGHRIPMVLGSSDFDEAQDQTSSNNMFQNSAQGRTIVVSGNIQGIVTGASAGNYQIDIIVSGGVAQTINLLTIATPGATTNFSVNFSQSVTINAGENIQISGSMNAGQTVTYGSGSSVLFTETVETITGGDIDAYPVYEAFLRALQIITGGSNPFYSTKFGRTDTPLTTYTSDGELTHITKGLFIRDLATNNTMPINLLGLFEAMAAIFNVGLGIETIAGEEKVRVEDLSYFFDDGIILDFSSIVDEDKIVTEAYPELIYNKVSVGYNKFDYEESQGLLEFNTKTEYSTIINNINNTLLAVCGYRADSRGIKNLRVVGETSDDAKGDDDIFVIATERDGADFDALTDQDYDKVSGGFDASQSFNLDYSPSRNVRRHGMRIRAGLELYTTSKMKWQYNEKNSELVTRKTTESTDVEEKADITISDLDAPRWIPEKYIVEVPFTMFDLAFVDGNPRGIIKLSDTKYGWILDINSKSLERTAELTLLRVNTDEVTPVIKVTPAAMSMTLNVLAPTVVSGSVVTPSVLGLELAMPTPTIRTDFLSISPSSMLFDDNGDICPSYTDTLTITASGAWTASSNSAFVTLSKYSGSGNDTLTVICAAQGSGDPFRFAEVEVVLTGTGLDETMSVDQVAEGDTCI